MQNEIESSELKKGTAIQSLQVGFTIIDQVAKRCTTDYINGDLRKY